MSRLNQLETSHYCYIFNPSRRDCTGCYWFKPYCSYPLRFNKHKETVDWLTGEIPFLDKKVQK